MTPGNPKPDEIVYFEVDRGAYDAAPKSERYKLRSRYGWTYFVVDHSYDVEEDSRGTP